MQQLLVVYFFIFCFVFVAFVVIVFPSYFNSSSTTQLEELELVVDSLLGAPRINIYLLLLHRASSAVRRIPSMTTSAT
jgi:hypothetical protein